MAVEVWQDVIDLIDEIKPLLKAVDKITAVALLAWALANKSRREGLNQEACNNAAGFMQGLKDYLPLEYYTQLNAAIWFFNHLNDDYGWNRLTTKEGCGFWGHYWYSGRCNREPYVEPKPSICPKLADFESCILSGCWWWGGACHAEAEPPPTGPPPEPIPEPEPLPPPEPPAPEPEPEPQPVDPGSITSETKCLAEGFYWYDGACHADPKEPEAGPTDPILEMAKDFEVFCKTIPVTDLEGRAACNAMARALRLLSKFFAWQRGRT